MNLICWADNRADRHIMVQGINDQCDELTHISFYKVRFLIKFWWEICKVCCNNFTNISLIIILIEFIKSVCEQSECCTYEDTSGVTLFQLFRNIKHTFSGRDHIVNDKNILSCYIITFDAHDPRVQNAIPLSGFDSFNPQYQFLKALFREVPDLKADKEHLMIISPDEGAMHRAVYFSNVLGVDMGMFYKRRDYSTVINGKNPIVAHEFLGDDVTGKDVLCQLSDLVLHGTVLLRTDTVG